MIIIFSLEKTGHLSGTVRTPLQPAGSGAFIHLIIMHGDIARIWMESMKAALVVLPRSLVPCKLSHMLSIGQSSWPYKPFQEHIILMFRIKGHKAPLFR